VSPDPLLLAAGVLLLAVAWAWRALARARTTAVLRRAARDPRRWVRRAAVEIMAEQGLHRFADLMVERIAVEEVPAVREALALAIVRNQWESADSPLLMRLRLWAHLELQGRRDALAAGTDPVLGTSTVTGGRRNPVALPPANGARPSATIHRLRASGDR
jgi:HEAT repeats